MQLRNIAIVDLGVLRAIEPQVLQSYFADDRVDGNPHSIVYDVRNIVRHSFIATSGMTTVRPDAFE
jgi:hypothetical protein